MSCREASEHSPEFALLGNGSGAGHVYPWQIVLSRFGLLENGEEFTISGITTVAEVGDFSSARLRWATEFWPP